MLIDTHTHLNFDIFDQTRDEVIQAAVQAGIEHLLIVGTDLPNSQKAIAIAEKYNGIYASVGLHPHHVFGLLSIPPDDNKALTYLHNLESLMSHPKVVAVGETGMDKFVYQKTIYPNYQISPEFLNLQAKFFAAQIQLAVKHHKSLIVHNRLAVDETLAILRENWSNVLKNKLVFHMCEPNEKILDFAYEKRVFIGIDGDITYDKDKQKFLPQVPLDLLVLETDSPFLPPKSQSEPNTPANLRIVLDKLTEIHGLDKVQIEVITTSNAKQLFNIA